jgi:lipopolysaccharide biosynthesis regulator YciM
LARSAQTGIVSSTAQADEATRFDLALAFLQVGLDEDAMLELQVLAQGGERVFEASVGLGRIFFERGLAQTASRWFERAMAVPDLSSSDSQRVRYSLGRACEAAGDVVRALHIYVDLLTQDARFEDVAERVGRLRPALGGGG